MMLIRFVASKVLTVATIGCKLLAKLGYDFYEANFGQMSQSHVKTSEAR